MKYLVCLRRDLFSRNLADLPFAHVHDVPSLYNPQHPEKGEIAASFKLDSQITPGVAAQSNNVELASKSFIEWTPGASFLERNMESLHRKKIGKEHEFQSFA